MEHNISNNLIEATVSTVGAELISLKDKKTNKEYIWGGHEPFWHSHAPNLFPIVGRVKSGKYNYNGKEYSIKSPHGFVRITDLKVIDKTDNSITLQLNSNEDTLKSYPFNFSYTIKHTLNDKTLTTEYIIKNTSSDQCMLFSIGVHPGFNVPLNENETFEDYYLEFDKECHPNELICDAAFPTGDKRPFVLKNNKILNLKHNLFDNDAVVMENTSKQITLKNDKGPNGIKISFDDFKYVAIWHTNQTQAPFLCIEPWNGLPSMKDSDENFEKKPELIKLDPGKEYTAQYKIEIF